MMKIRILLERSTAGRKDIFVDICQNPNVSKQSVENGKQPLHSERKMRALEHETKCSKQTWVTNCTVVVLRTLKVGVSFRILFLGI